MRIVSGELKGRRFSPPSGFKARPTTDFAKENIFNVLNNFLDFSSVKVLDLFAGTGSISFEFASRGCDDITAVEKDFRHYKFIRKVIEELDLNDKINVIKGCAFRFIERTSAKFDVIFADPPYDMKDAEKLPEMIMNSDILNEKGIFIFEHSDKADYSELPYVREVRKYGKVNFTVFEKPD
ncbi:MAG: methyltransferase domain-containing protein [Chlorobi bacterium]|nr:methyltransferase domain-containing protein [Chlorobiota bacterium]